MHCREFALHDVGRGVRGEWEREMDLILGGGFTERLGAYGE